MYSTDRRPQPKTTKTLTPTPINRPITSEETINRDSESGSRHLARIGNCVTVGRRLIRIIMAHRSVFRVRIKI